jgi:hypothetical protein
MFHYINVSKLVERVDQDAASFATAKPYKHIVCDDLLVPGCETAVAAAFPDSQWTGWDNVDHQYQRLKNTCSLIGSIPAPLDRVLMELNCGEVLSWLERLTGVRNLLPDPHLGGGGLHTTFEGGYLVPHTDFHTTSVPNYFRRLNLLLYLNPAWKPENGSSLELWERGRDAISKEVLPSLNRCVVFQTDDQSVHGFSRPVSGRSQRNSIALYYYTSSPPDEFSGDANTYWRVKSLEGKNRQTWVSIGKRRFFLGVARAASGIAWRASRKAAHVTEQVDPGNKFFRSQ